MKRTTLLAFSVVLALIIGIVSSGSMADAVKPTNPPDSSACPADKVQHWYTVRVQNNLSFIELRSTTNPTMFDNELYYINIQHDSNDTIQLRTSVTDRLNDLGYVAFNLNDQSSSPILESFDWIAIAEFELKSHSTICADI